MQNDNVIKLFVNKYSSIGEDKFYKFLINYALSRTVELSTKDNKSKSSKIHNPALELMDYYDMLLKLYRREGDNIYLDLSRQFRKAAHKIYRISLKKGLMEKNNKFLNIV